MAAKKSKTKSQARRRRKKAGGGFMQRVLVALAGVTLVLCAASITHGFFFRGAARDPLDGQFRIEVLNGTGRQGLAHAVKRSLHRRGIDVIDARNAPSFDYDETVLIARKPNADVERLGEILGCSNVVVQLKEGMLADATLILGADYRNLNLDWELETDLLE
jgi:hypothetical protein